MERYAPRRRQIASYGAVLGLSFLVSTSGGARAQEVLPKLRVYEPEKETIEVCMQQGVLPKTLRDGCRSLGEEMEMRKKLLEKYLRFEAQMKKEMASAGGAVLVRKLEEGKPVSKVDRDALAPYISASRRSAAQINEYSSRIKKAVSIISWYAENHYRKARANPAGSSNEHVVQEKAVAEKHLGAVHYKWHHKREEISLDPKVVEICSGPAFYMLPAYVAADCAELSAGLGKPSLVQYYNRRISTACTNYGFSPGIPPSEKKEFLAEKLYEYRHREMSYGHAERLELEIVNFWRMGHANLEQGLKRCGSYPSYGELGEAAFVILMIALVWRAKM